ncbi:MAG: D-alanine--D-alanine ligase [Desulfuromonadales bacterium]
MSIAELKEKKIGVLMGGLSAEREISLRTGQAVLGALQAAGYRAVGIDAGRDLASRLREEGVEIAFIALHGRYGEDGAVQGLLEILGIPYTGSGILASAIAMDKITTKYLFLQHGVPTPDFHVFRRGDDRQALLAACRKFPVVAKPAREGSTIGVTIAHSGAELERGIDAALLHDAGVLVEEFIEGLEVTVGVLDGAPLPIIQVVPKGGFYDYQAKYTAGQTEYILPAPLAADLYRHLQQTAVKACALAGCTGAARVDFMVRGNEFFCLEINTIPGMTATSLLPKAAGHVGISFAELVERILAGAALNK